MNNLRNIEQFNEVKLHTILNGVMGTSYTKDTNEHLEQLGLDCHQTTKLTRILHQHALQYSTKIVHTRYALQNTVGGTQGRVSGASARNPPDPH